MKQKKAQIDNNKTKKAQASRFCSTASHYSSGKKEPKNNGAVD